ncbi:MAG TPA: MFS transporter [Candidatus Dorea merdavium]|nr:MFS transporter [Candidatus Dorea merdavium]
MAEKSYDRSYEKRIVILFSLTWGFLHLNRLAVNFMMPAIMESIPMTNAQVSYISGATTVAFAISSAIIGYISDRTGHKKWWIVPLTITAGIFAGLSFIAQSFGMLIFFRAAFGVALGPILVLIYNIMEPASTKESYGKNTGYVNSTCEFIVTLCGPILMTQLCTWMGWRNSTALICVLVLLVGLIMIKVVRDTGKSELQVDSRKGQLRQVLRKKNVVLAGLIAIMALGGYWIIMNYAPLYWVEYAGLDINGMGIVTSSMGVLAIIYAFIVPKISDNVGRKPVLAIVFGIAIIAPIVMAIMPESKGTIAVYALIAGLPISTLPIYYSIVPYESVPDSLKATAGGFVAGVGEAIGGAVVPAIAGNVCPDLKTIILSAAIVFGVAMILSICLTETNPNTLKKRREKEEMQGHPGRAI